MKTKPFPRLVARCFKTPPGNSPSAHLPAPFPTCFTKILVGSPVTVCGLFVLSVEKFDYAIVPPEPRGVTLNFCESSVAPVYHRPGRMSMHQILRCDESVKVCRAYKTVGVEKFKMNFSTPTDAGKPLCIFAELSRPVQYRPDAVPHRSQNINFLTACQKQ